MLKLIHASKIYAKNGICALNAVDLTVQDGDYISVTGASGSGKSTLMHILGLLDSLTDGEYLLDGAAVAHLSAKQRARLRSEKIGFVFQQFRLLTGMTALENVALPLALQGVPRHERSERALAVLERVGLSDPGDSPAAPAFRRTTAAGGNRTGGRDRTVRDSGG